MRATGRDIWGVPPGGFEVKPARRWIRPAIASGLVLLLGVGVGSIYASMKKSTAVSTQDAIAEFRAGSGGGDDDDAAKSKRSKDANARRQRARKKLQRAGASGTGAVASGATEGSSAQAGTTSGGGGSAQATSKQRGFGGESAAEADIGAPKEGVYSWEIDGYERGPGVERRLPKRSHRIIQHEGKNKWVEHHIYSEQKEQWFHLGMSQQGVAVSEVRNRVEMGPVEVDRTVMFDPPAFVSTFPFQVNQTWDGTWEGKTRGSYSGKTIDHGFLTIGGERVEVWVTEVHMEMSGEVEGTVITRSWVAPDYNIVVRQYQESNVESGPGSYYSEWEGQMLSLHPQR